MNGKRISIYALAAVALMIALVFISNYLSIPIPTAIDKTRLHLGNVMCLLGALLLGKWKGGLAAGLGSMLYDLTVPAWAATCWITFINKFLMAFICGLIIYGFTKNKGRKPSTWRLILGTCCGAFSYVALYLGSNAIKNMVLGWEAKTILATMLTNSIASLINAAIAVPAALLLFAALRPALKAAGLGERLGIL